MLIFVNVEGSKSIKILTAVTLSYSGDNTFNGSPKFVKYACHFKRNKLKATKRKCIEVLQ